MKKTIVTKDGVERVDMTPEEEAEFVNAAEVQRLSGLQSELTSLMLTLAAKGFLWLVKLLITKGVIQLSDIPAKLITYKTRIEEIEVELNP